jgi:hypothetical protein
MARRINSGAQVDGGDEVISVSGGPKTSVSLTNKTVTSTEIDGSNSTKVVLADGGDTSDYSDVPNAGDDGVLDADVKAGEEFNGSGYNFDGGAVVAVELPIEGEQKTQVLKMQEVGSGMYILRASYVAGGGCRTSFLKGSEAQEVLRRGMIPCHTIKANVDRVLTFGVAKRGLLLKSSSVFGVQACEAPFKRGLRNSKYSLFSRTGVNLVNSDGCFISMPGCNRLIASSTSDRSVRKGSERCDLFGSVEQAYIGYLRSQCGSLKRGNAVLSRRVKNLSSRVSNKSSQFRRVISSMDDSARRESASLMSSLHQVVSDHAVLEAQRAMIGTKGAIESEQQAVKSSMERDVSFLSSLYM